MALRSVIDCDVVSRLQRHRTIVFPSSKLRWSKIFFYGIIRGIDRKEMQNTMQFQR